MNTIDLVPLSLNNLPFFSRLQTQQKKLLSLGKMRKIPTGEVLIEQESIEPVFFILLEGICQVRKLILTRERGQFKEVILRHAVAPTMFGKMSFLDNRPHLTSVITTTPCEVWELTSENITSANSYN